MRVEGWKNCFDGTMNISARLVRKREKAAFGRHTTKNNVERFIIDHLYNRIVWTMCGNVAV